jgi:hypothetical protein
MFGAAGTFHIGRPLAAETAIVLMVAEPRNQKVCRSAQPGPLSQASILHNPNESNDLGVTFQTRCSNIYFQPVINSHPSRAVILSARGPKRFLKLGGGKRRICFSAGCRVPPVPRTWGPGREARSTNNPRWIQTLTGYGTYTQPRPARSDKCGMAMHSRSRLPPAS